MNNNELNLKEITLTLSLLNHKKELSKDEKELKQVLEQKRESILGNIL